MLESFCFHHIGVATGNIEKTASYYLDAGYIMSEIVYDPVQDVRVTFLTKKLMPTVELLEPGSIHSPVSKILEKSGVSPYHACYSVTSIDEALRELKKKKFVPLFRPVNAIALENNRICFLFNKDVGLIELVEDRA